MKKVLTIEFEHDEEDWFYAYVSARKTMSCLTELSQLFRSHEKHNAPPVTREVFHEVLSENGVELP